MKRNCIGTAAFVCFFILFLAQSAYSDTGLIRNIDLYSQQESNWCWAAVTQTVVAQNRGSSDSQCRMATRFIHRSSDDYCCYKSTASSGACNQGYYLYETFSYYDVLDQYSAVPISQARLVQEVSSGYPVAFSVMWATGGGHALMFYGASSYTSNGRRIQTVNIWDPANGGDKVVMTRSRAERYAGGRWTNTFTTKCPNNACGGTSAL